MRLLARAGLGLGLALALGLPLAGPAPAQAQAIAAAPLSQVDSWGVGWLGAGETNVAPGFWSNTTGETLGPVFAAIDPGSLSPAGRAMLRRILLSKTKTPVGGAGLAPERLRLIEQLGYAALSADLRKRYPDTEWGAAADRVALEVDLVHGRKDGCSRLQGRPATDRTVMPLRAFCAALNADFDAAALAAEQVAASDEALGVWLLAAVENMREPTRTKPDGRYASAFEAAVSVSARLSAPAGALQLAPPDVAAAIALNPAASREQRRAALRRALDSDRLAASDVLAVLTLPEAAGAASPAKAAGRTSPPKPDPLAAALSAFASPDAPVETRAAAYATALRSAESAADARLVSLALANAVKVLPRSAATLPYAEVFARAALFAGDARQAQEWRRLMASAPKDALDAWALARLDLALAYAGASAEKPGALLERLIAASPLATAAAGQTPPAAAPPPAPAPAKAGSPAAAKAPVGKSPSPADKQVEARRIETTRVLFLYAGGGRGLSPAQRNLLAAQKSAGRGVSDAAITRITAAIDEGASGEAAMAILGLLGPDLSALSFAGLSDLLAQLKRIGFDQEADAFALEALQIWKAF